MAVTDLIDNIGTAGREESVSRLGQSGLCGVIFLITSCNAKIFDEEQPIRLQPVLNIGLQFVVVERLVAAATFDGELVASIC